MSVAHEYMIKTLLKAIGVNPDDLQPENIVPMLLCSINVTPEDAKTAFSKVQQFIVDYETNQAHLNMRLTAILDHLGIDDPTQPKTLEDKDHDRTDQR